MSKNASSVGRIELLNWINSLLNLKYTTIQETANGAAFCQVMDALSPGTVNLARVNFKANTGPESFENYKILQECFDKNHITRIIDVESLSKGGFLSALEMLQFFYNLYHARHDHPSYDPDARRRQFKCLDPTYKKPKPKISTRKSAVATRKSHLSEEPKEEILELKIEPFLKPENEKSSRNQSRPLQSPKSPKTVKSSNQTEIVSHGNQINSKKTENPERQCTPENRKESSVDKSDSLIMKELKKKAKEISSLKQSLKERTEEKDFYFEKLRKIEDFCQDHQTDDIIIGTVLEILYEQDPENGFVSPEEEDF